MNRFEPLFCRFFSCRRAAFIAKIKPNVLQNSELGIREAAGIRTQDRQLRRYLEQGINLLFI